MEGIRPPSGVTDLSSPVGLLAGYWNHADQMSRLQQRLVQMPPRSAEGDPQQVRPLRRLSDIEIAELVATRTAGAQINELAEQFGIHRATVITHLERAGLPGRRWPGRTLTPEQIQAAGALYATGLNLIEVGERLDVDRRYLRKALPAAGFALRRPGRQLSAQNVKDPPPR